MSGHVVMFSGGIGSWMTAKRVVEQHGERVPKSATDPLWQ